MRYKHLFETCLFLSSFSFLALCQKLALQLEQCPGPIRYYESIRCVAQYQSSYDICPSSYDCSNLNWRMEADQCNFNGKIYNNGQLLDPSDTFSRCLSCECIAPVSPSNLLCESTGNCGDAYYVKKSNCYHKLHDGCCEPLICPENATGSGLDIDIDVRIDSKFAVITCSIDDYSYKEGELFVPRGLPGVVCQCLPGLNEKVIDYMVGTRGRRIIERYCTRNNCFDKMNNPLTLNQTIYPPIFEENTNRFYNCPVDYLIGSAFTYRGVKYPKTYNPAFCTLGNYKLPLGTIVAVDYQGACMLCACELPMQPTCVRYRNDIVCKLLTQK